MVFSAGHRMDSDMLVYIEDLGKACHRTYINDSFIQLAKIFKLGPWWPPSNTSLVPNALIDGLLTSLLTEQRIYFY